MITATYVYVSLTIVAAIVTGTQLLRDSSGNIKITDYGLHKELYVIIAQHITS